MSELQGSENKVVETSDTSVEPSHHLSRRAFVGTAAIAGASLATTLTASPQTRQELLSGRDGTSPSNPGPKNDLLMQENPDSNEPPFTDHGDPGVTWYSFDLTSRRVQDGGWTHQVTHFYEVSLNEWIARLPDDLAQANIKLPISTIRKAATEKIDRHSEMNPENSRRGDRLARPRFVGLPRQKLAVVGESQKRLVNLA